MDMAVATLDDGGVGVLQDRRVLECYPVVPVDAVRAAEDGEGRTGALLLGWLDGPVVADHGVGSILQGHGIDAAVVVGRIDELELAPRLAVVAAVGDADMTAAGAAEGLQTTVRQLDDGGLDGLHTSVGLDESRAAPCLAHVVGEFEVDFPAVALVTGGSNQPVANEHGLVLDGAVDVVGQLLTTAPRLAAILRGDTPAFPASHVGANLEVELQFTLRGLEEHGVPAGLALAWFVAELVAIDDTHTVGHFYRRCPVLAALRLTAHPDADIGITLLGAAEIGGHEVALLRLDDAGRVALGKARRLVEELVTDHLRAALGQFTLQVVGAGAELHKFVARQTKRCLGVGGNLHMPVEAAVLLTPAAHNLAVDGVVTGIDMVNLVDGEVGIHGNVLETDVGSPDTGNPLVEPRQQVAEQHDVVAAVHRR